MSNWQVPLADVIVDDADIDVVVETYRSGWLSMGPRTAQFEEAFASYVGVPHAFAAANGTAALHLATLAAGLGPGDEVIVPSMTFVATANAIAYTGATPVFADIIDVRMPLLDPDAVAAAITPRTRAIMHVPYGGHPGETLALLELAAERDLLLLEDAAHAVGSTLDGRHLGAFGALGAYSFFSNKNLAVGEGGMVVCHDDATADRIRLLRSHGMTTLTWDRHRGHASGYDVVALGFNYRMDEARAALGTHRLARLDAENDRRREHDAAYREAFAAVPGVEPALAPPEGWRLAHHLFTVVLDSGIDRDAVRARLAEQRIQTSLHYPPAHRFSQYAGAGADLPRTDDYAGRTMTLPMFAHLSGEQLDLVVSAVAEAVASLEVRTS
jgi:dTDP-4-amino-4,6-dideoxygalactose transaminase